MDAAELIAKLVGLGPAGAIALLILAVVALWRQNSKLNELRVTDVTTTLKIVNDMSNAMLVLKTSMETRTDVMSGLVRQGEEGSRQIAAAAKAVEELRTDQKGFLRDLFDRNVRSSQ